MKKITAIIIAVLILLLLIIGLPKQSVDNPIPTPTASDAPNTDSADDSSNDNSDIIDKEEQSTTPPDNTAAPDSNDTTEESNNVAPSISDDMFDGYTLIEVDGGDLSGHREPNVVVDIGFGEREYWAFTNEHGQLVKVVATQITLQDDNTEPVLSTGRYYRDEAKVPGVESKTLDEGHVIADSLGGVSNAYNITPQNSTLNRHGDQAYMEDAIRKAGGCTNFVAIIEYPDTKTQIPSHYTYSYTINGEVINDSYPNGDPDENNANLNTNNDKKEESSTHNQTTKPNLSSNIIIEKLDKKAEYIILKNTSSSTIDLTGWKIVSVTGNQSFVFPAFELGANSTVKVGDEAKNSDVHFHWLEGKGVWNNSSSDPAEVYNSNGELISRLDD